MTAARMLKVGLTGNAGAGKSTVARIWRDERGAFVIDADRLGAEAVAPGTPALAALVERFGPRMLREDGGLDRGRMARIAFNDPEALAALNSIVHPEILRRVDELLAEAEAAGVDVAVVDAALIFEFGLEKKLDGVVLVDAPLEVRRERVLEKGKMDAATFERVCAAQLPPEELRQRADYVIENNGGLYRLRKEAILTIDKMEDKMRTEKQLVSLSELCDLINSKLENKMKSAFNDGDHYPTVGITHLPVPDSEGCNWKLNDFCNQGDYNFEDFKKYLERINSEAREKYNLR